MTDSADPAQPRPRPARRRAPARLRRRVRCPWSRARPAEARRWWAERAARPGGCRPGRGAVRRRARPAARRRGGDAAPSRPCRSGTRRSTSAPRRSCSFPPPRRRWSTLLSRALDRTRRVRASSASSAGPAARVPACSRCRWRWPASAAGHATVLVDLDPSGGGLDLALGARGLAGRPLARPRRDSPGSVPAGTLESALPQRARARGAGAGARRRPPAAAASAAVPAVLDSVVAAAAPRGARPAARRRRGDRGGARAAPTCCSSSSPPDVRGSRGRAGGLRGRARPRRRACRRALAAGVPGLDAQARGRLARLPLVASSPTSAAHRGARPRRSAGAVGPVARSGGVSDGAAPRAHGPPMSLDPDVLDRVRAQVVADGRAPTTRRHRPRPARRRRPLAARRPARGGHAAARRARRRRPAHRAAARPGRHRRARQPPRRGLGRPRSRRRAGGGAVRRRRRRAPTRAAAGVGVRAPARRRHALRRRAPARRHARACGARAARRLRARASRCGCRAAGSSRSTSSCAAGRCPCEVGALDPAVVDGAARRSSSPAAPAPARPPVVDAARARRPAGAHRARGGLRRAAPGAPARRPARGATRQHRGRRRGDAARPRPSVAADAARPGRRRRGSRRRGRRPARGAQHRPRGRVRHGARQLRGATCRPASRRWRSRPGSAATRCTPSWQPGSTSCSTSCATARALAGGRRCRSPYRAGERTSVVEALAWRDGRVVRGPAYDRLADAARRPGSRLLPC